MRDATRSLFVCWAALMALSLIMGFAGQLSGLSRPGALSLVVIAFAAVIKARIILRSYLGLARSPGAAAGFFTAVFAVLALVAVSFLILPTPVHSGPNPATDGAPAIFAPTFAGGTE